MASTTAMNPYRAHDSTVSVYQVPEFVVDGEKMLFHALYGNEAYEKLRKCLANLRLSPLRVGRSFTCPFVSFPSGERVRRSVRAARSSLRSEPSAVLIRHLLPIIIFIST